MNPQYQIGYEVLGPIFRLFCYRLRLVEQYKKDVPLLFLSRGGLRLRYFYELYLATNRLPNIAPQNNFYISRMAALRALMASKPQFAAEAIANEYRFTSTATAMRYFLPTELYTHWHELLLKSGKDPDKDFTPSLLLDELADSGERGALLRNHVQNQHDLLTEHFELLRNGRDEVTLVDTGWSGSIINSLNRLFPSVSITAVFFGRFNYGKPPPPWFELITGLILQNEFYAPWKPQSALVFHRHLIESTCEPDWPSVEYYVRHDGLAQPASGEIPAAVISPRESESIARGIGDFIDRERVESPAAASREYLVAIKRLAKLLTYPSAGEAKMLGVPPRTIDFGQDFSVPVLLDRNDAKSRLVRVRRALWHQGQAALEFGILRIAIQFVLTWWYLPKRVLRALKSFR